MCFVKLLQCGPAGRTFLVVSSHFVLVTLPSLSTTISLSLSNLQKKTKICRLLRTFISTSFLGPDGDA